VLESLVFFLQYWTMMEIYLLVVCFPTKCLSRIGFATRLSLWRNQNPMKVSLTFIKLFQKWESVGFLTQLPRVLSFMYLFLKRSCDMPSSFNNLNSHLLNKHLFCMSTFCIPKPPYIFGWHKISHLANLYLRFCWSFCQ
jgi:hypothetical protein